MSAGDELREQPDPDWSYPDRTDTVLKMMKIMAKYDRIEADRAWAAGEELTSAQSDLLLYDDTGSPREYPERGSVPR